MPPKKGKKPSEPSLDNILATMKPADRRVYLAQIRNAAKAKAIETNNRNNWYEYLVLLRKTERPSNKQIQEIRLLESQLSENVERRETPKVNHKVRKEQERLEALRQQQEEREAFKRQI